MKIFLIFLVFTLPTYLMAESSISAFDFGGNKQKKNTFEKKLLKLEKKYNDFTLRDSIPIPKIEKKIDMAYKKKEKIETLWKKFYIADTLAYIIAFFLMIIVIVLAYLIQQKYENLSVALFLLSIAVFPLSHNFLQDAINNFARKSKIINFKVKTFKYSTNVFISGDIVSEGLYDFDSCKIDIVLYKKTDKKIKDYINLIKPISENNITVDDLKRNEYRHFAKTIYSVPKDVNFTTDVTQSCR